MKTNPLSLRLLTALLGLTLGVLTVSQANAANLLLNGGFEFGQAPGTFSQSATYGAWTAVGANGPALLGMPYAGMPTLEGANAMHIGNARLAGIVRQSFATTIGQQYVVRLWAIGFGQEAGAGTIRVYNSAQTNLTSSFSSSGGYRWRLNAFKFTASGIMTTLELQNLPPAATTIDHVSVTPVAGPGVPGAPEIETFSTDRFAFLWSDSPSDAADAAFWAPSIPAGQDIYAFGHVVNPGYSQPPSVVVGKALTPTAFAFPLRFTMVWNDSGSDADRDGASWEPVPPVGYVSLGTALQDNTSGNPPPTNSLVCVREDLVVEGAVGDVIWTDGGSGPDADFSAWKIVAPQGAIGVGAFTGVNNYSKPSGPVYCLKASAVAATTAPTAAELEQLLNAHGPIIRFHPAETYFPDDPAAILNRPDTTLQWSTVQNEDSWSGLNVTNHAARFTSAGTILDDVQSALSHPQAGNGDFRYYLNFPQNLVGNLSQAKAYVRVQPYQGLYAELQFWIFYPWNAAGKIHASCVDIDYDPTGPVGQHWSDWESIRVRVSRKNVWNPGVNTLASVVMSRHDFDEEVAASDPRLQILSGRPVVYSAKGSHAQYPTADRQYYKTVGSKDVFFCTVYATLYDLTGNGVEFPTYLPANRLVVSSAWPGVATAAPDWLFFGGNWGNYEQQEFVVSDSGIEIYRFRQVEHGKPGLIRRNAWAVVRPENANLGTLRTSAGPISPSFSPLVANYSATVGSGVSQVTVTPQAADHTARVYVRLNGVTFTNGSGPLLGKASVPLNLNPGANVISITVNSVAEGAVTAEKTYTLTVTRQTQSAIVVNTNDAGAGSLRQVITDVPAGTTITFAPNLSGQTIVLGGTQLLLNKNLAIDASALPNPVRISGNNAARVFQIAAGSTITLQHLFVTGGNAAIGGGIDNSGTLFLSQVTLFLNSSTGRGGAIYNRPSGTLAINSSTLYRNTSADLGGAIVNEGSLALTNSTVADNMSLGSAGLQGFGGGIFNFDVPLTLNHCTLAGNSAATLGGGLRTQGGTLNIQNTIIAGNSAPTQGPDIANNGGTTIIGTGANLIGDNATVTVQFPAGPLVGTTASPRNPRLAPLNYYLGPTTMRPPLPGSPVIDAAVLVAGTPATDQRGGLRPSGPRPDLGAVEAFALSLVPLYDLDGDGIDDRLESAYPQLTNGVNDRELDSDGDGSPDGEELYNMTDPNNPNDALRILSMSPGVPGLVAQWVADDWTGGSANWVDRVAGRIATVPGAANSPTKTPDLFPLRGAAAASGLVFDGVNDYLSVTAAQNPIVGKTSVTIAACFLSTNGASGADGVPWQYPGPLNAESPAWPNDWALTYDAAGNAQGLFNFEIIPSPAVSLIDGQPHTMILTWQDPSVFPGGGVARLYVDGLLAGSTVEPDGGDGIVNNGFVIGSEPELLSRYFSGAISELRFYDSIQDPAAVHADMTGAGRLFLVSFRTFLGLAYELETGSTLPYLTAAPGTQITATTTNVTLPVLLDPDAGFVRVHRGHTRWATRVLGFSSEYTSDIWSAAQALGQPNTYPAYGDIVTAWASASADGQPEFLELGFDAPAPINAVSIYETLAPGAVTKVSVRNAGTGLWEEVWSGAAAPAPEVARIFTVTFPLTTFPVDAVRIDLNSPAVPDWNEIDAVSIITSSP